MNAEADPTLPKVGRAKSCINCRQVKLSCDARRLYPAPCTRCAEKQFECTFVAGFKRVPARKRLQEVTSQLAELKAAIGSDRNPSSSAAKEQRSHNNSAGSGHGLTPTLNVAASSASPEFAARVEDKPPQNAVKHWLQLSESTIDDFSLKAVTISGETATVLFEYFNQFYLPHIPILRPVKSLRHVEQTSPVLFWTIVLVACERHEFHDVLYHDLVQPQEKLLTSVMSTAIPAIDIIHALLIACLWPVPKLRQNDDPSWNYIGVAINAAMKLGLHQPFNEMQNLMRWIGVEDKTLSEAGSVDKAMTWLACFNINVRISNFIGLSPSVSSTKELRRIEDTCQRISHQARSEFLAQTEIQRLVCTFNTQLDGIEDYVTLYSLMDSFEDEINATKTKYDSIRSSLLVVDAESAKLYLFALFLVLPLPPESSSDKLHYLSCRNSLFAKVRASAALLITTVHRCGVPCSTPGSAGMGNGSLTSPFYSPLNSCRLPKWYLASAFFAAIFLLKILSIQPNGSPSDRERALNSVSEAHALFQALGNNRDAKRAAILIEVLDRVAREENSSSYPLGPSLQPTATVLVRSHLGASLQFDGVILAAMYMNTDPVNGTRGGPETWLTLTDMESLPLTPEHLAEAIHELRQSGLQLNLADNG